MPSPLAEAFLMGILNGCYETPSYMQRSDERLGKLNEKRKRLLAHSLFIQNKPDRVEYEYGFRKRHYA